MKNRDLDKTDRRVKWWLLITSVLTLAVLVTAMLRENVFAQWRFVRQKYSQILNEKATDPRGKAIAEQFEIRIVQNVLPELGTIDRCITCHPGIDDPRMVDQDQPFRTHPGSYLTDHPPEKFGCTVCHRGQGRALVFEEAKADGFHWDYPLLPLEHVTAECSRCHNPLPKMAEPLADGQRLYTKFGCGGCHKIKGVGGVLGPDLSDQGQKIKQQFPFAHIAGEHNVTNWLYEHFLDPAGVVPESQMPRQEITQHEARDLTTYMLSLRLEPRLTYSYLPPAKRPAEWTAKPSGKNLYMRYCSACHGAQGEGIRYPQMAAYPAIGNTDFLALASDDFLRSTIQHGRTERRMPAWGQKEGGLADEDINAIMAHLRTLGGNVKPIPDDRPPRWANGQLAVGENLFKAQCASCHGPQGQGLEGPSLSHPNLLKYATDTYLFETVKRGRTGTTMPAFGKPSTLRPTLTDTQIESLITFIRTWENHP
ncbi:MAG: c-type cytochrome [Planctomycetes bacterium]|nr:c-type cytochrome [Planctomycetota bacterium]